MSHILPLLLNDPYLSPASKMLMLSSLTDPAEDLLSPFCPGPRELNQSINQLRAILAEQQRDTSITHDKNKFHLNVDVQQFKPEEITVTLVDDNTLSIEGKHEERQDEHGFISRHFVRKYALPEDCDIKQLQTRLSSDGVLAVTAPKKPTKKNQVEYRQIPIIRTGKPIKTSKINEGEGDAQAQGKL